MRPSLFIILSATAVAGAAACDNGTTSPPTPSALTATTALSQSARAGGAVAAAPGIRVTDERGRPLSGVPVLFSTAGGGAVTVPSSSTAADGTASAGQWTLGTTPGTNTVTALVAGLPPVTFTATALDPCTLSPPLAIGGSAQGELDPLDCRMENGQRVDYFTMELGTAQSFVVEFTGAGDPSLSLLSSAGRMIAATGGGGAGASQMQVLALPAGAYFVGAGATASGPAVPGSYTLTARATSADVTGCAQPWIMPGLTTTQQLTTNDSCVRAYSDRFRIYLRAGQTITVAQNSAAFDAFLVLWAPNGSYVAVDDDSGEGLNSLLTYTAPAAGAYTIEALSFGSGSTGAYTLIVQ
jgi:hypothetical protein